MKTKSESYRNFSYYTTYSFHHNLFDVVEKTVPRFTLDGRLGRNERIDVPRLHIGQHRSGAQALNVIGDVVGQLLRCQTKLIGIHFSLTKWDEEEEEEWVPHTKSRSTTTVTTIRNKKAWNSSAALAADWLWDTFKKKCDLPPVCQKLLFIRFPSLHETFAFLWTLTHTHSGRRRLVAISSSSPLPLI